MDFIIVGEYRPAFCGGCGKSSGIATYPDKHSCVFCGFVRPLTDDLDAEIVLDDILDAEEIG